MYDFKIILMKVSIAILKSVAELKITHVNHNEKDTTE